MLLITVCPGATTTLDRSSQLSGAAVPSQSHYSRQGSLGINFGTCCPLYAGGWRPLWAVAKDHQTTRRSHNISSTLSGRTRQPNARPNQQEEQNESFPQCTESPILFPDTTEHEMIRQPNIRLCWGHPQCVTHLKHNWFGDMRKSTVWTEQHRTTNTEGCE